MAGTYEHDFRLRVFQSVARHLSFTKAARELFITQPAATKHIKELETALGLRLFDRKGNRIMLTTAGNILLKHAGRIFSLYKELELELNTLRHELSGHLRLGASTTLAQYVIPPVLAGFYEHFPAIHATLKNANTEQIENALLAGDLDLGIVEGQSHQSGLKYELFMADELVAVASRNSPWAKKRNISLKELPSIPLVLRERGSGTLDVIEHALSAQGLKLSALKVAMHLGNTEAIKLFLQHADCMGFLSMQSLRAQGKDGPLQIINIPGLRISRHFRFCYPQGQAGPLAELFMKFSRRSITSGNR